ncbi:MAG: YCF48-related protein [Candidatus Sulfotelmatobacter sp.]
MESVPKFVVKRLQWPVADSHPDADLLTAFAEQSLAGVERDSVIEHLARCGDCREVVSLALLPQVDAPPVARSENWFGWTLLRGSAWRWGAVGAGVILIASVGVMQFRRQQGSELASNVSEAKPAISAPAPSVEPSGTVAVPETQTQEDALATPRARTQTKLAENKRARSAARQNPVPAPARTVEPAEASPAAEAQSETAQVATQSTAESQLQDQIIQSKAAEQSPTYANRVDKAKPASPRGSLAMAPAPLLHTDPSLLKGFPAPRWTITAGGALQRSFDGGKTWLDVEVAATAGKKQAELTAGQSGPVVPPIFRALSVSSNAAEVWAGGSSGALYHTVDAGSSWARVLPSVGDVNLTGDITSIQFSDPRNGIVTTSTAEVWTTPDDGQTWLKQP